MALCRDKIGPHPFECGHQLVHLPACLLGAARLCWMVDARSSWGRLHLHGELLGLFTDVCPSRSNAFPIQTALGTQIRAYPTKIWSAAFNRGACRHCQRNARPTAIEIPIARKQLG